MKRYSQVRYWVEDLPKMGKSSFSIEETKEQFPEMPACNIKNTLFRLSKSGKIRSVWQGFYVISLPEYGLSAVAPPSEYIGHLMKYIGSQYYIGLLSAAALEGAAHQAPQVFQVVCEKHLRDKMVSGIRLEMIEKKVIPGSYLVTKTVNSGIIKVSSPELTAIDLLLYPQRAGGISHIATVLSELAETTDFNRVAKDFFLGVPPAVLQRLGFIFDEVLEEKEISGVLFDKIIAAGISFRKVPLVPNTGKKGKGIYPVSQKWKVEINYTVEPDI